MTANVRRLKLADALPLVPAPKRRKREPLPSTAPRDCVVMLPLAKGPAWGEPDALLAQNLGHLVREATPGGVHAPAPWGSVLGWAAVAGLVLLVLGVLANG